MTAAVPSRASFGPIYLKLVLVALFWGGTFIAGRVLVQTVPHATAAFARFFVASLLLLLLCWRSEGRLPRLNRQQIFATAGLGLTGIFLYNLCFFGALGRMEAGRTALFVTLNPIVTAIAAHLVLKDRLSVRQWGGIIIALVGAGVIITRGDLLATLHDVSRSFGAGEIMMLGAVLSWAAYTLVGRIALRSLSALAATTYAGLWGLLFLLPGMLMEVPSLSVQALNWANLVAVLYLGALGTVVGFVWYGQGVHTLGPSRTAVFNNLVPLFGVVLAVLVLDEPVLISMAVGGVLCIVGVALVNRRRS